MALISPVGQSTTSDYSKLQLVSDQRNTLIRSHTRYHICTFHVSSRLILLCAGFSAAQELSFADPIEGGTNEPQYN